MEQAWPVSGQYDTELNAAGLEQAGVIAQAARGWGLSAIYASPLTRTMQVAGEIGKAVGLTVSAREGLMELGLGELEGVTGEEMRAGWPQVFNTWNNSPELVVMPGGESPGNLEERSWKVILELQESHGPEDNLAIISHTSLSAPSAARSWVCHWPTSTACALPGFRQHL